MTKRILVPIDLHQKAGWKKLLKEAVAQAKATDGKLILLNVVDIDFDTAMVDRFSDIKKEYAAVARQRLKEAANDSVPEEYIEDILVTSGRSYSKVVDTAAELDVDLIMMAAHKSGMADYLLGMTAARVVRHAGCSVMVVRS